MAVKLRLTRVGSKKNPIYRVVAADSRSPRDGKFIEIVGRYNPQTDPSTIELDADKVKAWLEGRAAHGAGAQAAEDRRRRIVEDLLEELARRLVDDPAQVKVVREEREDVVVLHLHVAPDDVGKVIGRGGTDRTGAAAGRPRVRGTRAQARPARDRASIARASTAIVGRVGKPHGISGAFFVEEPSDDPGRYAKGATLYVDGEQAEVVESKQARGRPVIRFDREVPRGRSSEVDREALPPPTRTSTTSSSSSAWPSSAPTAPRWAAWLTWIRAWRTTSSGSTPDCCCRSWKPACGRSISRRGEFVVAPGFDESD